jgi:hypothetical protein
MIIDSDVCEDLSAMICVYRGTDIQELKLAFYSACVFQFVLPSEILIVKDGPVNNDVDEFITYVHDHHKAIILKSNKNVGHGRARNIALSKTSKKWIAIVDSDDFSKPDRFFMQLNFLQQHKDVSVLGSALTEYEMRNGALHLTSTRIYPESEENIHRFCQRRCPVAQPTAILNVEHVRAVGGYLHWYNNEDYHLWLRLIGRGYKIRNLAASLVLMKFDRGSLLRRRGVVYWWNELKLQWFSYKLGITKFRLLILGAIARFVIQVLMPPRAVNFVYSTFLR